MKHNKPCVPSFFRMWNRQLLCCCSALIAHYSSNSQSSPSSVPWLVFPTWHFSSVSFVWWKRNVSGPQFFVSGAFPLGIAADSVLVVCLCSTIEVNKLQEELKLFFNCCSASSSSQTSTSSIIPRNFALRDCFVLSMVLSPFSPTIPLLRQSRRGLSRWRCRGMQYH